jgi:hypothetical protein
MTFLLPSLSLSPSAVFIEIMYELILPIAWRRANLKSFALSLQRLRILLFVWVSLSGSVIEARLPYPEEKL